MQVMQSLAAPLRHFASRAALLAAGLGCALLLSACASHTSSDLACKDTSADAPMTGKIEGNVVVPRNATCHLQADVAGDVTVKDGARIFVYDGTAIKGSFRAIGAAQVRFNLDESPAGASGRIARAAPKIFVGSNLVIKESRLVGESGITATEIGGNLVIARNADGGGAKMNVCTPGMCRPEAAVKVAKSVKIKQNQIAVAMANTAIGADLKCASNDRVPVLMKTSGDTGRVSVKGHRFGQCEHLRDVVMNPVPPTASNAPLEPVVPGRKPKA